MEHTPIATFARFTLQLLALGAPPHLVRNAQAATSDEMTNARIRFARASAHAGRSIGPSSLALDGGSLRKILVTATLEGYVGETVASLETYELAEKASDPAVRRAHAEIANDEARHAELTAHGLASAPLWRTSARQALALLVGPCATAPLRGKLAPTARSAGRRFRPAAPRYS